ncbi:MAG: hypothetical protein JNK05_17825 [Myxococcales bacterium]|nr:hypothetical protein [Myxococcales bacterium]
MKLRELEAVRASLVASLAAVEVAIANASDDEAKGPDTVALEDAVRVLGSKRKAREFFARAERQGFEVRRVGHAVFMARGEWDRALEALRSKRSAKTAPTHSTDESPAAILAGAGLAPHPNRGPRRAA